MQYLELFLHLIFTLLILVLPLILIFALIADAAGWYDSNGFYIGPFSKRR